MSVSLTTALRADSNPYIAGPITLHTTGTVLINQIGQDMYFNAISGTGSSFLLATQVAFGDPFDVMTSDSTLTYDVGAQQLSVPGINTHFINNTGAFPFINVNTQSVFNELGTVVANFNSGQLALIDNAGHHVVDWGVYSLVDAAGVLSMNWNLRTLPDGSGVTSIDYSARTLFDIFGNPMIVYQSFPLGVNITGLTYPTFDGSAGDVMTTDGFGGLSLRPPTAGALTATYVGFGSVSNTLTGDSSMTYDVGAGRFAVPIVNISQIESQSTGMLAYDIDNYIIYDGALVYSILPANRTLNDGVANVALDWLNRQTLDSTSVLSVDWERRALYDVTAGAVIDYSQVYKPILGDAFGANNQTQFTVDDPNRLVTLNQAGNSYLYADMSVGQFQYGDIGGVVNSVYLDLRPQFNNTILHSGEQFVVTAGTSNILQLDHQFGFYAMGDYSGSANSTYVYVSDLNREISLASSGTAMLVASRGETTLSGGLSMATVGKSGAYTLTYSDSTVVATSGTFAFTLPTAVGHDGRIFILKNIGTGIITMNTTSGETIDGNASGTLTLVQWDSLTVQAFSGNWIRI